MLFKPVFEIGFMIIFLMVTMFVLSVSCKGNEDELSATGKILEGEHIIKDIDVIFEDKNGRWGAVLKEKKYTFTWQTNNGSFVRSVLSLEKVQVEIDSMVDEPYAKFRWRSSSYTDIKSIMKYHVVYMEITCTKDDFPELMKEMGI